MNLSSFFRSCLFNIFVFSLLISPTFSANSSEVLEELKKYVAEGNQEKVESLLKQNSYKDKSQLNSLVLLAMKNHRESVMLLLVVAGANPNVQNEDGESPLMVFSSFGPLERVRKMVESGAEVNHQDSQGATALVWAASNNESEIVEYLLSKGANPNPFKGEKRAEFLRYLIYKGNIDSFRLLFKAGLDLRPYKKILLDQARINQAMGSKKAIQFIEILNSI